jgi:hypothetical protein
MAFWENRVATKIGKNVEKIGELIECIGRQDKTENIEIKEKYIGIDLCIYA